MRVFVTGASGWIGSAVVPELIEAGHHVVGLARSDASADAVTAAGAEVHRGSLDDLDSLDAAAAKSDGIIHLAFIHDFTRHEAAVRTDRRAIAALGAALAGSERPLIIASGVPALSSSGVSTENDPPHPNFPRSAAANMTIALADRGVRSSVVRLPPSVHGQGDNGFVPTLVSVARLRGSSAYIGDGSNRWPAVHRADAARLFRLTLEHAPPGSVWNAVADEGVPTRAIAETIGRHLHVPAAPIDQAQAAERFSWLAPLFAADAPATSTLTRQRLGWQPTHPGLIDDLDEGHYFKDSASRGLPV